MAPLGGWRHQHSKHGRGIRPDRKHERVLHSRAAYARDPSLILWMQSVKDAPAARQTLVSASSTSAEPNVGPTKFRNPITGHTGPNTGLRTMLQYDRLGSVVYRLRNFP